MKSQHRFRSDHHVVYTEEVNKIVLSSNGDKRIQTFDKVTTYLYGSNTFMVCQIEMLSKNKFTNKSDTLLIKDDLETKLDLKFRNLELLLHRDILFTDDK